ncbi:hypothetical protein L596_013539 [Steinernema carpocapsae]|uniref:Uncharacterized protein n=1 Tax=Steinernema carpocapsae TaxID=34508 RepID=A0A4V6A576_STECR|nr:hypothetical protein L596_013539 [Steinernema carpocapsae]
MAISTISHNKIKLMVIFLMLCTFLLCQLILHQGQTLPSYVLISHLVAYYLPRFYDLTASFRSASYITFTIAILNG